MPSTTSFPDGRANACYDPLTGGGDEDRWLCRFPGKLLASLWEHAPSKYYQSFTAREVIENAEVVYYGIRIKDGKDAPAPWGYCFVGVPKTLRIGPLNDPNGGILPIPIGCVFTVYVSQAGEVFEWRLEPADPRFPTRPQEHDAQRFPGGAVWQRDN